MTVKLSRRRTLRTKLLIAMASMAVGAIAVTGVTTIALARSGAERHAIANLQDQAPGVRNQLTQLARVLANRSELGRPPAGVGRLITSVLRVTGGTILTVRRDGSVTEGVTALADGEAFGRDARIANRVSNQLPADLSVEDFDAEQLLRGERQTGTVEGRAFIAEPIRDGPAGTSVLVLTETIDSEAISRARGFFLVGAALAVVVAGIVAYGLARRLTRPLAAMGATASSIASGDFAARVDLAGHPDDELTDLAHTLNGMALQLEHARDADRAFLLSVSHDLRTPLTSIRGYAEALTDGTIPATDEQRRAGEVIRAEASRLERLVADLLDLARLDARQFSLAPRDFDISATVRTAVDAFSPAAGELGIELHTEAPDAVPAVSDPERVAQIVANLVENALKFARTSIEVSVVVVTATEFEIRVVDDGPGILSPETTRVFERLFVSRAVPGRSVGTGLGLAIVGELSAALGGSASVDPAATSGATFVVRLPTF